MKKYLTLLLSILTGLSFSLVLDTNAFAAKKKNSSSQTLKAISNEGVAEFNGSVLKPKANDVNVALSRVLLTKIKKIGLSKLNVTVTSIQDSTKTYSVPSPDGLSIQRKTINKKGGPYLVVSLFNLTNSAGVTISPSSLPSDNYKLSIAGTGLDATTESFLYRTPALIVGTVESETAGLVSVESLHGDEISDGKVATSPNGTFFTEVTANHIGANTRARRFLKAQTIEATSEVSSEETINSGETQPEDSVIEETIDTAVIHAVTDTDLKAIVPLSNDPENNAAATNEPIKVDETSSLTAELAVESAKEGNEDLAVEIAREQLENFEQQDISEEDEEESNNSEDFNPISCNIEQFASRCSENEEALAQVGNDFKKFVITADCNFPEFKFIKSVIPKLPDSANVFIGKGYCEHATREIDEDRPCEIYAMIYSDFKSGLIKELVCPPPNCEKFRDIRPPKCFNPGGFCEEGKGGPVPLGTPSQGGCFHRPMKDLYCAKIGTDIKDIECKDDGFDQSQFKPGWKIEIADSDGAQYCVPSNFPKPTFTPQPGSFGPQPPSSSKDIANQCSVNSCHRECERKYPPQVYTPVAVPSTGSNGFYQPPKCDSCDCHSDCEKKFGRFVDCNPLSDYFKKDQCCRSGPIAFAQTAIAFQTISQPFSPSPTAPFFPPTTGGNNFNPPYVGPDVHSCLCNDPNNFDAKGYAKKDAQNACKDKCPPGFEKDQTTQSCVRTCPEGAVRGPKGDCRKQCPPGFIQDDFGGCKCPNGQYPNPNTGKCEASSCPSYCTKYPAFRKLLEQISGTPFTNPGFIPPTTGPGYVPPGTTTSYPPECQKCFGGCPSGQGKDPVTNTCIPITCGPNQTVDSTGACRCPDGSYATSTGVDGCKNTGINYCSPGIKVGTEGCTCWPGAVVSDGGFCKCTSPNQTYTKEYGCGSSTTQCPINTPIKCPDGSCVVTQANCSSFCPAPYEKNPNGNPPCKCPDATPISLNTNSGSTCVAACPAGLIADYPQYGGTANSMRSCLCPDKSYPNANGKCYSTSHVCAPGEAATISNPCYCANGGIFSGPNSTGTCQCSNGQAYTAAGCGTTATNYCSPGITPTSANPCTCNPSGGSYFSSSNTCTCPTGSSNPYTKEYGCGSTTQCPAATPYKCPDGNCVVAAVNCPSQCPTTTPIKCPDGRCTAVIASCTSTTTCPSPYVTNPAYNSSNPGTTPPCICPTGTYSYNNTCVATCPNSLVTGTPSGGCGSGPIPSCLCPGTLQCPGANGQCSTTTSHTCALNEVSTSTNPCTCATGATLGSNGQCQCTNGQVYASGGCPSSTTSHVCAAGEAATTANPCTCAGNATFSGPNSTGTCQCPSEQTYSSTGCSSTASCPTSLPIRCSDNTCAATQASCPCPGSTPIRCSDGTCAVTQANCPSQCPSPYVVNPSGTPPCKCPDATPISHNATCVASCPSPLVQSTPPGAGSMPMCSCPTGQMQGSDPNTCVACPACTGGKIFSGTGCTCSCPQGQTEVNGQCQ